MTLAGTWQNDYGSQMILSAFSGNLVYGTYASTTGSTGKYMVIGYQQPADPTSGAGQACSLAIEWHSIVAGPGDPSWNWSSGLSGQNSIEKGKEALVLAHAMVASTPFPDLAAAGTYIDKLTYYRVGDGPPNTEARPDLGAPLADPLQGTWQSSDGNLLLQLNVYPYSGSQFGWVSGTIKTSSGSSPVDGVTDINARAGGLTLQSTAITALTNGGASALALAGTLNLSNGQLVLTNLASQSTAPDAAYVQTTVSQVVLRRVATDAAD